MLLTWFWWAIQHHFRCLYSIVYWKYDLKAAEEVCMSTGRSSLDRKSLNSLQGSSPRNTIEVGANDGKSRGTSRDNLWSVPSFLTAIKTRRSSGDLRSQSREGSSRKHSRKENGQDRGSRDGKLRDSPSAWDDQKDGPPISLLEDLAMRADGHGISQVIKSSFKTRSPLLSDLEIHRIDFCDLLCFQDLTLCYQDICKYEVTCPACPLIFTRTKKFVKLIIRVHDYLPLLHEVYERLPCKSRRNHQVLQK